MTEDTKVKVRRKENPRHQPKNKEQASNKNKKRWKKHYKKPRKNLGDSLQELQAYINSNYHE